MLSPFSLARILGSLLILSSPAVAEGFKSTAGQFLTSAPVEAILLMAGGVFLLLSVITMGAAGAELCCSASFGLLLVGRYLQGEDPWVPLGLLVAGIVCLLAEVFVLPGFGVSGILGLCSLGAMTVLVTDSPAMGLTIFFSTTIVSVLAAFLAIRFLPHMCATRKLFILAPPERAEGPAPLAQAAFLPEVGQTGIAGCTLRPGGYANFGPHKVDVRAESEFVPKGRAVEVLRIEGSGAVVRSVPQPPTH